MLSVHFILFTRLLCFNAFKIINGMFNTELLVTEICEFMECFSSLAIVCHNDVIKH